MKRIIAIRKHNIFLFLILLIYFCTNLYYILKYPFLFHNDAYNRIRIAKRGFPYIFKNEKVIWPPGFQILLYCYFQLTSSILLLKIICTLIGVFSIIAFYLYLKTWFNENISLIGAFLFSFLYPFKVFTMVPYTEGLFFGLIFLGLKLTKENPENPYYYFIFSIASMLRLEGLLIGGFLVLKDVIYKLRKNSRFKDILKKEIINAIIAFSLFIFWILIVGIGNYISQTFNMLFNPDNDKSFLISNLFKSLRLYLIFFFWRDLSLIYIYGILGISFSLFEFFYKPIFSRDKFFIYHKNSDRLLNYQTEVLFLLLLLIIDSIIVIIVNAVYQSFGNVRNYMLSSVLLIFFSLIFFDFLDKNIQNKTKILKNVVKIINTITLMIYTINSILNLNRILNRMLLLWQSGYFS